MDDKLTMSCEHFNVLIDQFELLDVKKICTSKQ